LSNLLPVAGRVNKVTISNYRFSAMSLIDLLCLNLRESGGASQFLYKPRIFGRPCGLVGIRPAVPRLESLGYSRKVPPGLPPKRRPVKRHKCRAPPAVTDAVNSTGRKEQMSQRSSENPERQSRMESE